MKKIRFSCIFALLLISACASQKSTFTPQTITGLKTPESVIQAQDGKIYVSEINGFGQDGDGQIRMIDHGKVSVFASGLDDPKGLAIIGDFLYVADKTKVVKISLKNGEQKSVFVPATGFSTPPQFLNDLVSDADGHLYVTDSGDILGSGKGGLIYKINPKGEVAKLIDGNQDANMLAPNGLLIDKTTKNLLEVDFFTGVLYQLDSQSGQLKAIAQGFGGGDGIVQTDNTLYVSDWKNGKVFSVNHKGEVALLKAGYQSAADIALTIDGKYIMVPDMKAGVLDFIPLDNQQ